MLWTPRKRAIAAGISLLTFTPLLASLARANVAYVDARAPGGGDGTSWNTAFNLLQIGLAAAQYSETISEIRVAQGTYYPDRDGETPAGSGYRGATFDLPNGRALRGGFAGRGATDPNAQDAVAYPTILSGEIGAAGNGDNVYHVVTALNCTSSTLVEGFVITGGYSGEYEPSGYLDGAGVLLIASSPQFVDCVIRDNVAGAAQGQFSYGVGYGGGLYCSNGSPVLQNCILENNQAGDGQPGFCTAGIGNPGGSGGDGGGAYFVSGTPILFNCTIANNRAGLGGNGVQCIEGAAGGAPGGSGGGIFLGEGTAAFLVNCVIHSNQSGSGGNSGASDITGAAAGSGAGLYSQGTLRLINCTFTDNSIGTPGWPDGYMGAGSAAYANVNNPDCVNSIGWGNSGGAGGPLAGAWNVTYTCIDGEYQGVGNLMADPLLTPERRLGPGSPCIDAGANEAYGEFPQVDADGWPRFMDDPASPDTGSGTPPLIDRGAFEFWLDCNGNGRPDYLDIQEGFSGDCNGNEIPDECDIAQGADTDCNGNGVPDACENNNHSSGDCNGNGIPDECDLAEGTSRDCNNNGVLDECDIASGFSGDCDGNGAPDECDLLESVLILDLGDLAVGGNGLGTGTSGAGITPRTGAYVLPDIWGGSGASGGFIVTKGTGGAANLPFVDGVFVPNGPTVVSSTGLSFSFPATTGLSWDAIRNAVAVYDRDADPPQAWPLRLLDDPEHDRAGLGMHTNAGITFDLATVRAAHPTQPVLAVAAMAGLSAEAAESYTVEVEAWVLVDGIPRWTDSLLGVSKPYTPVVVPISPSDRFVTLATTDAGSMTADHAAFADAKVILARVRDCNHNGVLDECDIAGGTSLDCNGNGIPDECDLASGTSLDGDHNGVPDECQPDSDGDGVIDALDGCPLDRLKTAPGSCGCGVADADTDGDGVPNCLDGCPTDPLKTAAGTCGCGIADTDTDGDGVPDCLDNCPTAPNPDQADANGDGIGDVCDDSAQPQPPIEPGFIASLINVIAATGGQGSATVGDSVPRLLTVVDGVPGNALEGGDSARPNPNDPNSVTPDQLELLAASMGACPATAAVMLTLTFAGLVWTWPRRR